MIKLSDVEEFNYQVFEGLELDKEEIKNKDFVDCRFVKCNFFECDFSGSEFSDCTFEHCSISLTKFFNCGFRTVKFSDSKLVGIDLTKSTINFFELGFKKCLIDACNFSMLPMESTVFDGCVIRECIFGDANLTSATFDDCDLEGTLFHNTKLEKADFSSAKNYAINPVTNSIKGAKFTLPEAVSLLRAFGIDL